eukprot:2093689-Pyramimonas_sp.AAC.1
MYQLSGRWYITPGALLGPSEGPLRALLSPGLALRGRQEGPKRAPRGPQELCTNPAAVGT